MLSIYLIIFLLYLSKFVDAGLSGVQQALTRKSSRDEISQQHYSGSQQYLGPDQPDGGAYQPDTHLDLGSQYQLSTPGTGMSTPDFGSSPMKSYSKSVPNLADNGEIHFYLLFNLNFQLR